MSTHKHFEKICCVVLVLTLLLTVLFMNAEAFGIKSASKVKGYETRLFDTSRVHTLDIVIDDWDGFLSNCTNEEYVSCAVVIDNESYKNVAIRAKGNTSLTNVRNYGNNRYSFKIEFDHYDSTKSYHGLDKLSLNNIIQDNTYLKDYLCYQMMGYFGVNAPLCSFVQINVNGEEWGLYLAVEGVEDAFLERNYGKNYGELYKPDSISMGGGKGNGGGFNMDDWEAEAEMPDMNFPQEGMNTPPNMGGMQSGMGGMGQAGGVFNLTIEDVRTLLNQMDDEKLEQIAAVLGYAGISELFAALNQVESLEELLNGKDPAQIMQLFMEQGGMGDIPGGNNPSGGNMMTPGGEMGGGMGSDDVKLVYTDDQYSSYSNIFENAKTSITDTDRDRLIASLKSLNQNSGIEDVVDVEQVIRYFVVHNFVCNFDSYTGSMIHNYYLYEEDGKLSMIPWDYNLAFGGFVGGTDATSMVNYPIDSPVSGGTTDSRPMIAWIFNNPEYTEMYHRYFAEFIEDYFESGYFSEMIDSVKAMISPYVESDPTKFCTYEEFEKGIDTLKEFCLLRAESVGGQLDGSVPSTSDGQSKDSSSLIPASVLNISDMGSMNNAMGGGMDFPNGAQGGMDFPNGNGGQGGMERPSGDGGQGGMERPSGDGGQGGMERPDNGQPSGGNMPQGGNFQPDGNQNMQGMTPDDMPKSTGNNTEGWILLSVSCVVLAAGLAIAIAYKKRV